MKILIAGAHGQLGLALARRLAGAHQLLAPGRGDFDITNRERCAQAIADARPDLVLNCAAYTAVDRAESERDAAFAVNAAGAGNLASACRDAGATLVHFSTDYVFDGAAGQPYVESDRVAPQSVYGASKLAGERAVIDSGADHLILRLSWVYGNDGGNFYKTMLRLAAERPTLRVVADQWGVPNYTADLADAVAIAINRPRAELAKLAGLYHLSATGTTNWCEFARAIIRGAAMAERVTVEAISTSDYPTAAKRPAFSALNGSRFAATFGWNPPEWRDGLRRCLAARG